MRNGIALFESAGRYAAFEFNDVEKIYDGGNDLRKGAVAVVIVRLGYGWDRDRQQCN
ncbi:MAG: hypothetical protein ACRD3J_03015 [Thermoanaerobaculia bacterium]